MKFFPFSSVASVVLFRILILSVAAYFLFAAYLADESVAATAVQMRTFGRSQSRDPYPPPLVQTPHHHHLHLHQSPPTIYRYLLSFDLFVLLSCLGGRFLCNSALGGFAYLGFNLKALSLKPGLCFSFLSFPCH